jgi:hypothetical protein
MKNPGDLRHQICTTTKWSSTIDQAIFTQILTQLRIEFQVPDVELIIYKTKEFLKNSK